MRPTIFYIVFTPALLLNSLNYNYAYAKPVSVEFDSTISVWETEDIHKTEIEPPTDLVEELDSSKIESITEATEDLIIPEPSPTPTPETTVEEEEFEDLPAFPDNFTTEENSTEPISDEILEDHQYPAEYGLETEYSSDSNFTDEQIIYYLEQNYITSTSSESVLVSGEQSTGQIDISVEANLENSVAEGQESLSQSPQTQFTSTTPALSPEAESAFNNATTVISSARAAEAAGQYAEASNSYNNAISILENRLNHINGHVAYLHLLRDAYEGYLRSSPMSARWQTIEGRFNIIRGSVPVPRPRTIIVITPTRTTTTITTSTTGPRRQTAANCAGANATQTDNYCLYLGTANSAYAIQTGARLECTRSSQFNRLGGVVQPDFWNPRCSVNQAQAGPSDGWSSIGYRNGTMVTYSLNFKDNDRGRSATLHIHEATHLIIGQLVGHAFFRWADEGIATLAEPGWFERWWRYLKNRRLNNTPPDTASMLYITEDYPTDISGLYAVGTVLSNYFITELGGGGDNGRRKFVTFLRNTMQRKRLNPNESIESCFSTVLNTDYNGLTTVNLLNDFEAYLARWTARNDTPPHDDSVNCN